MKTSWDKTVCINGQEPLTEIKQKLDRIGEALYWRALGDKESDAQTFFAFSKRLKQLAE